tara:strand:+ start:4787 stop:5170 length:384 start_codon:yes stop_codon:yes gene_type:complete
MTEEKIERLKQALYVLSDKRNAEDEDNRCPQLQKDYMKAYQKVYYQENKQRLQEVQMAYREKHREEIAQNSREYYHANKDGAIKEYREDNTEKLKEYRKEYYLKNKETMLVKIKAYQAKKKLEKNEQ